MSQDEILTLIEIKISKHYPFKWITQKELIDLIKSNLNITNHATICKCLQRMRQGNDIPHVVVGSDPKFLQTIKKKEENFKFAGCYMNILKKIHREDLLIRIKEGEKNAASQFCGYTFLYKIR